MSHKARKESAVDPFMQKLSKLTREDRVSLAVDMSSIAMEITLGSIRDRKHTLSQAQFLKEARKRLSPERRNH